MNYRKEIDGLRAIAVLAVIFYHTGIYSFSGGYVGVDIFFVISGYLITTIILEDINNNKFSISSFYEHRIRRILPALYIVLALTTIFSYLLLPPSYLISYSKSLMAVVTFVANIFFYFNSGYFSLGADEQPLIHTWSLGVEEQFYLFFPFFLLIINKYADKFLLIIFVISLILSLSFSIYLSEKGSINGNFYIIFSRAWEFLFGSLISVLYSYKLFLKKSILLNNIISMLGFILVVVAITHFNKHTPFPSAYTLIPILGASLLVFFADSQTFIGKLLSQKAMVFIGIISYSLYLWHQPIISFLKIKSVGPPKFILMLFSIIITIVLSYFSWKYIEKPFRDKNKFSKSILIKLSLFSTLFFLIIGLYGYLNDGLEERFKNSLYTETIKFSPKRKNCHTVGINYLKPENACKYFSKNISWATFGDSHTVELAYVLAKRLKRNGTGVLQLSFSGCPPALIFKPYQPGCYKWIKESLLFLENNKKIKHVLIGFRYSEFLFGSQLSSYPNIPNEDPTYKYKNPLRILGMNNLRELYWKSFVKIVKGLQKSGKNVYILYPIPELPMNIAKAVIPFSIFNKAPTLDLKKTSTVSFYKKRNEYILKKLNSLPYKNNLHAIKPLEILCNKMFCPAIRDGNALYFDDNHLSLYGADIVINKGLHL